MIRVTVELVPYGVEEMAKTISEICIANVGGDAEANIANYEAAGYELKNNKIVDLAVKLESFAREGGALELVKEILNAERVEFDDVPSAPDLVNRTRLLAELETRNEK